MKLEEKKQQLIEKILFTLEENPQESIDLLTQAFFRVAVDNTSEETVVLFQRLFYVFKDVDALNKLNEDIETHKLSDEVPTYN